MADGRGVPELLHQFAPRPETPQFLELKKLKVKEIGLIWNIITLLLVIGLYFCAFSKNVVEDVVIDYVIYAVILIFYALVNISAVFSCRQRKFVESGKHPFFDQDESQYAESIKKLQIRTTILIVVFAVLMAVLGLMITNLLIF